VAGAVMAAGALDDAGCGVDADAEGVMKGGGAGWGGRGARRAGRRVASETGDAGTGMRLADAATDDGGLAFDTLKVMVRRRR